MFLQGFNPANGRIYKKTEDQLSKSGSAVSLMRISRYVAYLSKIKMNCRRIPVISASGIIPLLTRSMAQPRYGDKQHPLHSCGRGEPRQKSEPA